MNKAFIAIIFVLLFASCSTVPVNMEDVALIPKEAAVKYINETVNKNYSKSIFHQDENKTVFGETLSVTEAEMTYHRDFLVNGTRSISEFSFSLYEYRSLYYLEVYMYKGLPIRVFTNTFDEKSWPVGKKLYQAFTSLGVKQKN